MKIKRFLDLTHKAWTYFLEAMEQPTVLPSVAWLIMVKGVHLRELLKLNRHRAWLRVAGIHTVLDVGASTGQFSSAIRAILPDAQIYAFEPVPECYQTLSKKMAKWERFQAFCVAIGDRTGRVQFWRSEFPESSSVLLMSDLHKTAFPWTAKATPLTVEMHTLDNYLDKLTLTPSVLLKIDVQGYEYKVLQGSSQLLKQVDYVLVEVSFKNLYEGQTSFHTVYKFLFAQGFEYRGQMEQLPSPLDGTILQADVLFVRKVSK
jgi:FkbM family methyltransferase